MIYPRLEGITTKAETPRGKGKADSMGCRNICEGTVRWAMPENLGKLGEFGVLLISSGCVLIAAALAAPLVRHQFARYVLGRMKVITAKTIELLQMRKI